jgi:diguanylate cyclase (GGDEF)-like protein
MNPEVSSLTVPKPDRGSPAALSGETAFAFRDPLTGLSTLPFFQETLEREVARSVRHGYPLSLIVLRVDDLAELIQRHGPALGDRVVAEAGRVILQWTRCSDVTARLDDDTFAILAPYADRGQAREVAARVVGGVAMLQLVADVPGSMLDLRLQVGMATCPTEAKTAEEVMRQAGIAVEG